ncbi:MAG: hypothetical protein NZ879_00115 [Archaeoglobaceae archaeon]|nr:hypothetical protein [Archaeoglobaceae archaeon]MDW8117375.1 hypothetical protein [Archaeoglobaceae archaeon]
MVRLLIFALLTFAIINEACALHYPYSEAKKSDQWIHDFFSIFLDEFEKNIMNASKGENCSSPISKLEIVKTEIEFYRTKGVESNASMVVEPFLAFSRSLRDLCEAQKMIKVERLSAVTKMRISVAEMKASLDEIDRIFLYNETSQIFFNTSKVREALKELEKILDFYEFQLKGEEDIEGIYVFVSKNEPILFEKIRIWIYARNVTPLVLYIDEKIFPAKEMSYSFNTLGEHVIYAEGIKGYKIVKSNVVKVIVKKIPVYIVLKANSPFVGNKAEVRGFISDYYGYAMSVPLKVEIEDKVSFIRSEKGSFSFNFSRDYECSVNVSVTYSGNETHERAFEKITVYFSRYPVWIKLKVDRDRVFAGESVKFTVMASDELPLEIYVNNNKKIDLFGKNFSFSLKLDPGTYKVYAYFEGDKLRKSAKSNEVLIIVENLNFYLLFIPLFAVILIVFFGRFWRSKKSEKMEKTKIVEEKAEVKKEKEEKREIIVDRDISKTYSTLFSLITAKYGLPLSLTPRELFKRLENQNFAEKLLEITKIHEKFTYASISLTKEEFEKFFMLTEELIREI